MAGIDWPELLILVSCIVLLIIVSVIVATIVSLVSKRNSTSAELEQCPYCAEPIKPGAKVCRYCGRDLAIPERPSDREALPGVGEVVVSWEQLVKGWLTTRITVEEAEAQHLGETLLAKMVEGDELWEFSSPQEDWAALAGRAGIALVRNGEVIDTEVQLMS